MGEGCTSPASTALGDTCKLWEINYKQYIPVVDSWVDLESSSQSTGTLHSIHDGNSEVEKLLIEAQKESRTPSRANSKESSAQGR